MKFGEIWALLKQTVTEWLDDKAPKLAAALALYTMLSLGPLLVIVLKIIGVVYQDTAQDKARAVLSGILPSEATVDFAVEAAKNASDPNQGVLATILSVALLAFTATGVFGELQDSLNTIWEVKPKPNQGIMGFLRTRLFSFAAVLGIAFLFMVSTVGTTVVGAMGSYIFGENKVIAFIITTTLSLVIMTALFAMIFKLLPDVRIKWKDVFLGAVLTGVLFEIGKAGLTWYLGREQTKGVYGTAGALAVLLLYIYYSAQILFFGAEFTQVYSRKYGSGIRPASNAEAVTTGERANLGLSPGVRAVEAKPQFVPRMVVRNVQAPSDSRKRVIFGMSGLSVGAIAGLAGMYVYQRSMPRGAKNQLAAEVHRRIDRLENEAIEVDRAFHQLRRGQLVERRQVKHEPERTLPTFGESMVRFIDSVRRGYAANTKANGRTR